MYDLQWICTLLLFYCIGCIFLPGIVACICLANVFFTACWVYQLRKVFQICLQLNCKDVYICMPLMIIKATVKCLMSPPHTSNSWTNEKWYICLSSKCVEIDIVINIQIFCDAYYAIYKYFYKYNVHVIYKNLVHITLKVPLSARLKVKVSYLEYKVKWKYTICHLFIYVWCFWAITKMYVIGLYDHSLFFGRKILLPNTCTIHTAWKSSLVVQNRESGELYSED